MTPLARGKKAKASQRGGLPTIAEEMIILLEIAQSLSTKPHGAQPRAVAKPGMPPRADGGPIEEGKAKARRIQPMSLSINGPVKLMGPWALATRLGE